MRKLINFAIIILTRFYASAQIECTNLPNSFSSYNEAKMKVKSAIFAFKDYCNTNSNSWVKDAFFIVVVGLSSALCYSLPKELLGLDKTY